MDLAESLQYKLPRLAELVIDGLSTWCDLREVQIHESFKVRFKGHINRGPRSTFPRKG